MIYAIGVLIGTVATLCVLVYLAGWRLPVWITSGETIGKWEISVYERNGKRVAVGIHELKQPREIGSLANNATPIMKSKVVLEFKNPDSVQAVINALEAVKESLAEDYHVDNICKG